MDDNARTGELRRKLEKDPGSRLFAQLAEELRKDGKHDEAISVARKGLEKNPNYPSARLTLARALLDSGRPAEARPELESIVKASPDNIMASRLLGDALAELGETAQALQQFEKTLRISPGDKAVLERIAELKGRLAAPAPAPEAVPEPLAATSASASPVVPVEEPAPAASLPSVFASEPLPSVFAETPVPPPASVALDRDLASGTFSPGSLNAADIQKHFDETAAAPAVGIETDAQTIAFSPPSAPAPQVEVAEAAPEAPAVEMPPEEGDLGAKTLPLSSMTLADLYLQQGLKAEASAVLSQVLRDEPENAQAKSKFAAVSSELSSVPSAVSLPPAEPPSTSRVRRTPAEVRERTILALKAFESAVEREAVLQKATERGAF
jgi:tetratricopeptide (TPR) repeat protein